MLAVKKHGSRGILVVMLHWLGGSARTWTEVCETLSKVGLSCLAIDLPGFGESQEYRDFSIAAMVAEVVETIRFHRKENPNAPWLLAGHSMGGKLAALIARDAEQGLNGLDNLRGLVLLSPSPPGPEPMKESQRESTLQSLGAATRDPAQRRKHAERFVDDNTGKLPLLDALRTGSVDDVLRMNPEALVAWMTTGSKVDCSATVGRLSLPVLILAGTEEPALGPDAQRSHTLPHFLNATLAALDGCGHLAPLERPGEVSDRMLEWIRRLGMQLETPSTSLSQDFYSLIHSGRTSPQTRQVLLERMKDEPEAAGAMNAEELRTLRALAARVIPDAGFDLATRMDQALARNQNDGWRFHALPEDRKAWKLGLASLDAAAKKDFSVPFVALDAGRQDDLLQQAKNGVLKREFLASINILETNETLSADQMRDWFEDVRAELVKLYVADPRTMERIGFTGFADEDGFTNIRLEQQEEVEH